MIENWVRSTEVLWEELNGETLLVNPSAETSWVLNAAAAAVWKLCDGTRGLIEVAGCAAVSQDDVALFCERFGGLGLLRAAIHATPVSAPPGSAMFRSPFNDPPAYRMLGLGSGSRRRPSPRGHSGPG